MGILHRWYSYCRLDEVMAVDGVEFVSSREITADHFR